MNSIGDFGGGSVGDATLRIRILQVSSSDLSGGAERIAWNLFDSYRVRGYESCLAVGVKRTNDPDVIPLPHRHTRRGWAWFWWSVHSRLQSLNGPRRLERLTARLAEPGAFLDGYRGIENFRYPGTWRVLNLRGRSPNILHCHNLHGYFDLRGLGRLSCEVPTILTLHDAWLLSGHCAHSFDCGRWQIGCGQCPYLAAYPPVRRDATAFNWERKRQIYARSRLYIATPSKWLLDKVATSILAVAVVEARVINNGVDLRIFRPVQREIVRGELGLPADAKVLLFAANGVRRNPWKDYRSLRAAVGKVSAGESGCAVILIALGEGGAPERIGRGEIRFVPYENSPQIVARYYQAADLYVHPTRADTFPNSILEALACGTPVVATDVGGVSEQVQPLAAQNGTVRGVGPEQATGILTLPNDVEALARAMAWLLGDDHLRRRLSENAARDARERFGLGRQVDAYLEWYREIDAAAGRVRFDAGPMHGCSQLGT